MRPRRRNMRSRRRASRRPRPGRATRCSKSRCAERDWRGALAAVERRCLPRPHRQGERAKRQRAVLYTADALDRLEGDREGALASAQDAVKLAPDLVPAAALAGRLLSQRGDLRRAAKIVETAWRSAAASGSRRRLSQSAPRRFGLRPPEARRNAREARRTGARRAACRRPRRHGGARIRPCPRGARAARCRAADHARLPADVRPRTGRARRDRQGP